MKILSILCSLSILLVQVGCERGQTDIKNEKWKCFIKNNIRNCSVEFTAINKSHLPTNSIIRIRAHNRKSVMGSDAVQNIVVGDKILNATLKPGEQRKFNENIKPGNRVTSIIVTITSKEF